MNLTVYKEIMLLRIPPLQGGRDSDEIAVILTRCLLRHGVICSAGRPSLAFSCCWWVSTFRYHFFVTEVIHISRSGSKASFSLYHGMMTTFVDMEIKTMTSLTAMNNLYLVHHGSSAKSPRVPK